MSRPGPARKATDPAPEVIEVIDRSDMNDIHALSDRESTSTGTPESHVDGEEASDEQTWGSDPASSDPDTSDSNDKEESDYGIENSSSSSSSTESSHRHTDSTADELPYGQSPPLTSDDSAEEVAFVNDIISDGSLRYFSKGQSRSIRTKCNKIKECFIT